MTRPASRRRFTWRSTAGRTPRAHRMDHALDAFAEFVGAPAVGAARILVGDWCDLDTLAPMFEVFNPQPALDRPDLLAPSTYETVRAYLPDVQVFEIDPTISDTEALCAAYDQPLDVMGNAVLVAGKREGIEYRACCLVLANRRLDVNNVVRKRLGVHKASFMPMDQAVAGSGMEYGAITPVGLDDTWPIWLDATVAAVPSLVIGAGVRRAKLILPGADLLRLPTAALVEDLTRPMPPPAAD